MPWQWSAWSWVTISASMRPMSASSSCWRRSGPQSTSRLSPPLSNNIDERVRRLRRSCGSHWPHSLPIFGTPVEVPQPRTRSFTPRLSPAGPVEQTEEIGGGRLRERLRLFPAQLGDEGGGVGDEGRLAGLAAVRDRGEERGVGLDQQPVERDFPRCLLQFAGVLEGDNPAQRDEKSEIKRL